MRVRELKASSENRSAFEGIARTKSRGERVRGRRLVEMSTEETKDESTGMSSRNARLQQHYFERNGYEQPMKGILGIDRRSRKF